MADLIIKVEIKLELGIDFWTLGSLAIGLAKPSFRSHFPSL